MSCLHYQGNELYIENVSLKSIAATYATPTYVYSRTQLENNWRAFNQAFSAIPHRICYAVKANSNIAILNLLSQLGSGFDIVSQGELERVIAAGGNPKKIVFSGVGKTDTEILAGIQHGIYCFDIESIPELERIHHLAKQLGKKVAIALRVNPDVDPKTHSHISTGLKENKFGIDFSDILPICERIRSMPELSLVGIACHIGSQITELEPFSLALDQLITIYHQLKEKNLAIKHLNIGGGLGVTYHNETPPSINDYAKVIIKKLKSYPIELIIEPGRAIVANAGALLTQVIYLKHLEHKNFAIVDAGMNDLIRPALYDAWQNILPVERRDTDQKTYDIAGPVCESADFLGKKRLLSLNPQDLLAIDGAGAYGFSMSSNYNSRPRAAEVLIDDDQVHLIRQRETIHDLFADESIATISCSTGDQ